MENKASRNILSKCCGAPTIEVVPNRSYCAGPNGCGEWCQTIEEPADPTHYTLTTSNPLDIPVSSAELQSVLDYLLDLAEKHYPGYSSDSEIAFINDFYKKHLG